MTVSPIAVQTNNSRQFHNSDRPTDRPGNVPLTTASSTTNMADAGPTPAPAPTDASSNRGRNPRGGQRGARGGQRQRADGEDHGDPANRERGPAGNNRGRGRTRGNRGRRNSQTNRPPPPHPDDETPTTLAPGKARMFGAALSSNSKPEGDSPVPTQEADDDDVEAEVCFICASPVVHNSVAPCNHRTCHICALRLRALYKTKACAHCRVCIRILAT